MMKREAIFKTVLRDRSLDDLILLSQRGPDEDDLSVTGMDRDKWLSCVREVAKEKFNPGK